MLRRLSDWGIWQIKLCWNQNASPPPFGDVHITTTETSVHRPEQASRHVCGRGPALLGTCCLRDGPPGGIYLQPVKVRARRCATASDGERIFVQRSIRRYVGRRRWSWRHRVFWYPERPASVHQAVLGVAGRYDESGEGSVVLKGLRLTRIPRSAIQCTPKSQGAGLCEA